MEAASVCHSAIDTTTANTTTVDTTTVDTIAVDSITVDSTAAIDCPDSVVAQAEQFEGSVGGDLSRAV